MVSYKFVESLPQVTSEPSPIPPSEHLSENWPPRDVDVTAIRAESVKMKRKAKLMGEKASRAYDAGNHAQAQILATKATVLRGQADSLRLEAADAIFSAMNLQHPLGVIDLHGLYGDEAERFLDRRLQECALAEGQILDLTIITGWGKGQSGFPILKPLVEAYLRQRKLTFHPLNRGAFIVAF